MEWMEVSVSGLDGEGAEAVFEILNRWGHGGAAVEQILRRPNRDDLREPSTVVRAYLPIDGTESAIQQRIEQAIWHLGQLYPLPEPAFRVLDETDWENAWKQHYPVDRIGHRFVIVPSWIEPHLNPDDLVISLDPGQAFGTGLHPSTRLCVLELERLANRSDRVLDVGTGSGILAIAAARKGAAEVLALDTDPIAVAVARENIARNHVEPRVRVLHKSVADVPLSPPWNLIVANILAETIADLLPDLAALLSVDGYLIMSGIVAAREPLVLEALDQSGLRVVRRETLRDWVALIASR